MVRGIERLGRWTGTAIEFELPIARHTAEGRDGEAILVQRESDGAVLTAAASICGRADPALPVTAAWNERYGL